LIQDEKIGKDSLAVEAELQVMSFTQNFKQCYIEAHNDTQNSIG